MDYTNYENVLRKYKMEDKSKKDHSHIVEVNDDMLSVLVDWKVILTVGIIFALFAGKYLSTIELIVYSVVFGVLSFVNISYYTHIAIVGLILGLTIYKGVTKPPTNGQGLILPNFTRYN
jgi:hypothetical protein